VSTHPDTLPEAERMAFDAATDELMAIYAEAWAELWEFVRVHGLRAAAERSAFPGRDVDEIERRLREIQEKARAPQDSPAAPDEIADRLDNQVRLVELQVVAASFCMDVHAVG
jgi:hypothetical protein